MTGYTIRQALADEGFEVVLFPSPPAHPDALGDRSCCTVSMLLTGNRIALGDETWMVCYGAAHELAHGLALRAEKGWDHTDDLWSVQADLLSRWVKKLAHERGDF
jgi:hypothetical protein